MSSRMDKYYKHEEKNETASRTARNKNMYNKIDDNDYENINLTSNVSIIETDTDNLDIEAIKGLLNEKYQSKPARQVDIEDFESEENADLEDTKEYDLKKIIEAAHKSKTPDYDRERFKKLRETQYEILNSLNIDKTEDTEEDSDEDTTLMNLIKTVNANSLKNKIEEAENEETSGDLLGDLKGDEQTEVLEPMNFEEESEPDQKPSLQEELEKTKQLSRKELDDEITRFTTKLDDVISSLKKMEESDNEDDENEEYIEEDEYEDYEEETTNTSLSKTEELANSFYTGKYQINDDDMEDFEDLEKEMKGGSVFIKILIILIVLIVLAVGVYLLNKYLNLGLF